MENDISKLCADSLRTTSKDTYNIKLKAAHAHEIVCSYFGYGSKNAMLADKKYPINNLNRATIIVMMPDSFIDKRRANLEGLSPKLPDSYTLGEAVYSPLFTEEWWSSQYPPFKSFEKLAKYMVENSELCQMRFKSSQDLPRHHFVNVAANDDEVSLTVVHASQRPDGLLTGDGETIINLKRVAGRIGFGKPDILICSCSESSQAYLQGLKVEIKEDQYILQTTASNQGLLH